jgi:Protein of unknown function (DUF3500)
MRGAAFCLLEASSSARGLKLTRDIMRPNETLAELTNDYEFLGEWLYFITVMGKPSASEPWGFQLDGRHAVISFWIWWTRTSATWTTATPASRWTRSSARSTAPGSAGSAPTRWHIYCAVRTPNGNDYGKDMLRQHYQSHAHA